jgi:hypothetical protein
VTTPEERCQPLLDDAGNVIASVHGTHPMSPEGEAAMRALVAAAQRMAESDPEMAAMLDRQEAANARNHARLVRLGIRHDNT